MSKINPLTKVKLLGGGGGFGAHAAGAGALRAKGQVGVGEGLGDCESLLEVNGLGVLGGLLVEGAVEGLGLHCEGLAVAVDEERGDGQELGVAKSVG